MPEFPRVELATLEVQHPVVLGNEVQISSRSRDPRQLSQHAVRMRNGVGYVAAHRQVKTIIGKSQLEDAPVLKLQSGRKFGVAGSRQLQVMINNIDADHVRPRKKFCQPR
jgi:hypothetical protein